MAIKGTRLQKLGLRAKGIPPKRYRREGATKRSDYADPKRFKYPLHREDNVRNALSRFGNPRNRAGYPIAEQKTIARRIVRACGRFGITVDPASAVGRLAGLKRKAK